MDTPRSHLAVGYDGSAHASAALDWATAEASRRGLGLHVIYAIDHPALTSGSVQSAPMVPAQLFAEAADVVARGASHAADQYPELSITTHAVVGGAAVALVQASESASLVVVGSRGRGPATSAVLGSVSFAVTAHAYCPVVVVRGEALAQPGPYHPVVVGVDGSTTSQAALEFAANVAAAARAPLRVLCAWHPPAGDSWASTYWDTVAQDDGDFERNQRDSAAGVAGEAVAWVQLSHPHLAVSAEVVSGQPGPSLGHASGGAGLVVVGSRGRGGFTGLVLGSVSHAVITAAQCPVAVVRHDIHRQSAA